MIRISDDVIVRTIARIIIPFIQIYALYVIVHGHHSPGGGFQGGVILSASFVLLVLTHGLEETKKKITERGVAILSSLGLFIYVGIGLLCLILLGNYLDYGTLSKIFHVIPAQARSLGILGVEIGVGIAVMGVMFSIFLNISSGGALPEDDEDMSE
ncbi:MAG: MnhB domain-containing protein [Thermodesulfobacteriota bacterium]|nr:MnhB domain-containing protein [Thermodesulfobacteriota bacterium]